MLMVAAALAGKPELLIADEPTALSTSSPSGVCLISSTGTARSAACPCS